MGKLIIRDIQHLDIDGGFLDQIRAEMEERIFPMFREIDSEIKRVIDKNEQDPEEKQGEIERLDDKLSELRDHYEEIQMMAADEGLILVAPVEFDKLDALACLENYIDWEKLESEIEIRQISQIENMRSGACSVLKQEEPGQGEEKVDVQGIQAFLYQTADLKFIDPDAYRDTLININGQIHYYRDFLKLNIPAQILDDMPDAGHHDLPARDW